MSSRLSPGRQREKCLIVCADDFGRDVAVIYVHPAVGPAALIPDYRHAEELVALMSPRVRRLVAELGLGLANYRDLARPS
jgi:hypothetical protein